MGKFFEKWRSLSEKSTDSSADLQNIIYENRAFLKATSLTYDDLALTKSVSTIIDSIAHNHRIVLYADYDVDGTMSCISWIWFLKAIGYENFIHYIPCRFQEGYGLRLEALKHLIDNEKAQLIITMDLGITAFKEVEYCNSRQVKVICTDHHQIQAELLPKDCVILNPKMHPKPDYHDLCGCGITFILLRQLARVLKNTQRPLPIKLKDLNDDIWLDLLALCGMATICDIVPLNKGVNHLLARRGMEALIKTKRRILVALREKTASYSCDEIDIGFKLGPRINAVGRLGHADKVIEAFIEDNPTDLIQLMDKLNEKRKGIQEQITKEATNMAENYHNDALLFMGYSHWHQGVVGISASKVKDTFWKPTFLFQTLDDGTCKGSARSIAGYDITLAMRDSCRELFLSLGGHAAAAGYRFVKENEDKIRKALNEHAKRHRKLHRDLWVSRIDYDCFLPWHLLSLDTLNYIEALKPFGHNFERPIFLIEAEIINVKYYKSKITNKPAHTAVTVCSGKQKIFKIMFFNAILEDFESAFSAQFLVTLSRNVWQKSNGQKVESLNIFGNDYNIIKSL